MMNNESVKDWIIEWFVRNANVDIDSVKNHLNDSYFDLGYIDSFGFIALMADIEERFGIQLANDQFEDRSFSTIQGMANILEGLMK